MRTLLVGCAACYVIPVCGAHDARKLSRTADCLGRAVSVGRGEDHVDRVLERRSPPWVNRERPRATARAKPSADARAVEPKRRVRAALVVRPRSFREQGTGGHSDRGESQHRAEVKSETGTTRMVACGCVDEQHVGGMRERFDDSLKGRSLA